MLSLLPGEWLDNSEWPPSVNTVRYISTRLLIEIAGYVSGAKGVLDAGRLLEVMNHHYQTFMGRPDYLQQKLSKNIGFRNGKVWFQAVLLKYFSQFYLVHQKKLGIRHIYLSVKDVLTYLSDIAIRGLPEDMIHIFHVLKWAQTFKNVDLVKSWLFFLL